VSRCTCTKRGEITWPNFHAEDCPASVRILDCPVRQHDEEPVCPYCLHKSVKYFASGLDYGDSEWLDTCRNCGSKFQVKREEIITYYTWPMEVKL
jgi:hypothetical protein